MEIKRPVLVKVIMTEAFRRQMIDESAQSAGRIDEMLKSLDAQELAIPADDPERAAAMKEHIHAERERLARFKGELAWKVREIEGVQEGVELPFRMFESSVDIKVGDNFLEKMSQSEILLKDWQVIAVRE